MLLENLLDKLELPIEVKNEIKDYKKGSTNICNEILQKELKTRESWNQVIEKLKAQIGEDPSGFFILCELLNYACHTYDEYQKRNIEDAIFEQTMKFCTRFVNEHRKIYGYYAFTWAWWFPRQLTLQEFRIGELEYEFVDDMERKIYIHIPSDADMRAEYIQKSFKKYHIFLKKYYPDWIDVDWYCESWMLSPALKQLLPETSNILMFQKLFDTEFVDYESMAVLDWVYPGQKADLSELSENTLLQRNMKKFLLSGKKVGWAKGRLIKKTDDNQP